MNLDVREKSLETIEKIEANDPDLQALAIGFKGFSPPTVIKEWEDEFNEAYELLRIDDDDDDDSIDWKRLCTAIQRSKVLVELHFGGIEINPDGDGSNFRESDLKALMVAFAVGEKQLTRLGLRELSVPFGILFSEDCSGVLQKPGLHLVILDCDVTPGDINVLIDHFSRGNNLVRFEFTKNDGSLLLEDLGLLIRHLHHHQLESLSIVGARLSPTSIKDIAWMLEKSDSKLLGLELSNNGGRNNEFKTIVESLSTNKTLLGLTYKDFDGTPIESAQLIDRLLSTKDLRLKKLSTPGIQIADPEAAMLSKRFDSYGNLTYLDLELGASLTMSGWNALGDYIQSSRCILDQLSLPNSNLDDTKLQSLSTWISSRGTIKCLHLVGNRAITADGWRVFFHLVLENPKSKIGYMDISECRIDDETMNALASSLRRNCTLEEIDVVRGDDDEIDVTTEGWASIIGILLNRTSIMETYLSNHTLNRIGAFHPLPDDLADLLDFNSDRFGRAARLKVLDVHFAPGYDINAIRPFLAMDTNLLPQVINWIGKGEDFVKEFWALMYELVRHSQLFVEHGADHSAYSKVRSPNGKRQRTSFAKTS